MKKVKRMFLCLTLILSILIIPAGATSAGTDQRNKYSINEYDVYVQVKRNMARNSNDELTQLVRDGYVEKELSRRSQLPTEALLNMGYTQEQIRILREYKGEPIESNSALRGIFADLNVKISCYCASVHSIGITVNWEWSNMPLVHGTAVKESIGIAWEGTNMESLPMNLKVNNTLSYSTIKYVNHVDFSTPTTTKTNAISIVKVHAFAQDTFGTCTTKDNTDFSKSGSLRLVLVPEAPGNEIYSASFVVTYAHYCNGLSLDTSIGYGPFGVGISLPSTSQAMYESGLTITNRGNITWY